MTLANRNSISFRPGFRPDQKHWFVAIAASLVWLFLSFSLYSMMYIVRETFRIMTFAALGEFLELSESEHHFYNFFFACVACTTMFGFVANLFLSNPLLRSRDMRYHKPKLINTLTGLNWYFLFWFSKLGFLFGALCVTVPLFYYIDMHKDYKFIFVASPVVLFVYQWSGIQRVLKGGLKWMMVSAGVVLTVSFLFSRIDIINVQALDASIQKNIVSYNYRFRLPDASEATDISRWDCEHKLYLVHSKDSANEQIPIIVTDNGGLTELTMEDAGEYVASVNHDFHRHEPSIIALGIDSQVKMKHVKLLKGKIASQHSQAVYFLTATSKPGISQGLYGFLPPLCRELASQDIDYLKRHGKIPKQPDCSGLKREILLDELLQNSLTIKLMNNEIYIGDSLTTHESLFLKIYSLIIKFEKSGMVAIEVDDESDYGHYIQLKNTIRRAYYFRRDELAYAQIGKPFPRGNYYEYFNPEDEKAIRDIRKRCPVNVIEWTTEEMRILDILRKGTF